MPAPATFSLLASAYAKKPGRLRGGSFGHPIGASGLRMMYEMWLQLRGEAGPRQIPGPKLGFTHNLGGRARPVRQLRVDRRRGVRGPWTHKIFVDTRVARRV